MRESALDDGCELFAVSGKAPRNVGCSQRDRQFRHVDIPAIDMAELAITLGATYVARSFSGDRKQLTPIVQGALAHRGSAILDVISPCVTFNNHEGSTKSLKYAKGHLDPIHDIDFIPPYENIEADYDEGTDHEIG